MKIEINQKLMDHLKQKYFALIAKENIPDTPTLTEEADGLELIIKNATVAP